MFQVYVLKSKAENSIYDRYIKWANYKNVVYTNKIMDAASFTDVTDLKSYLSTNEINPKEYQVVLLQVIDVEI